MAIEDRVKQAMRESGKQEVFTHDYKVTYNAVTSTRFDSKTLKVERPELYLFTEIERQSYSSYNLIN